MKLIACANCPDRRAKIGAGREPYYARSFPGPPGRPAQFRCSGCGKLVRLTAQEFHALPAASPADLEDARVLEHVAKDLTLGGDLTLAQAVDLARAGLELADVHGLAAAPAPPKKPAKKAAKKKAG